MYRQSKSSVEKFHVYCMYLYIHKNVSTHLSGLFFSVISLGTQNTRLCAPPPSSVWTVSMQPTSVVYSWSRPPGTQNVIGYSYIFLLKGMLMHSGVVEAIQTSVIVGNLSPDTNGYDFRVAAILLDGFVGEFSSPLLVSTPQSSK